MDLRLSDQFNKYLLEIYPPDQPGAAVNIIRNGKIIFRKGYGLANLELNVPIEPNMVFRIGSITKQFTAVCILKLFEQGMLTLKDDINKHLPDFNTHGHKISIENLLTHTSGIPNYNEMAEWQKVRSMDITPEELIALFNGKNLEFNPGDDFMYSNSGYVLLGVIIEKITGMKYSDFIREIIFNPLKMNQSYYDTSEMIIPNRVNGYSRNGHEYSNASYLNINHAYAAGSLASTIDDLAIWDNSIYKGKIVNINLLSKAFKPFMLRNSISTNYGYGWRVYLHEGLSMYEHAGGINGFLACSLRIPEEKVFISILSNCDNPQEMLPDFVALNLSNILLNKPLNKIKSKINLPANKLDDYIGTYHISDKSNRIICRIKNQLFTQCTNRMKLEIYPFAADSFFFKLFSDIIIFKRDNNDKVIGMEFLHNLGPRKYYPKID